jgi:hypothetical protein
MKCPRCDGDVVDLVCQRCRWCWPDESYVLKGNKNYARMMTKYRGKGIAKRLEKRATRHVRELIG